MPLCAGRPDGLCPLRKNDTSVIWTIADLFLCPDCDKFRFPCSTMSDNMANSASGQRDVVVPHDISADSANSADTAIDRDDERFVRCELLYFIQNKCGVLTFDKLVNICTNFYRCNEVEAARVLLGKYKRLTKHIGGTDDERRERSIIDIVKLCLTPTAGLPVYFSVDMSRIPPVGVEHIDVSALLQEVSALREEVRSFAAVRSDIAVIRQTLSTGASVNGPGPAPIISTAVQSLSTVDTDHVVTATADAATSVPSSLNGPSFATLAGSLKHSGMAEKPHTEKKSQARRPVLGRSTTATRLKSVVTKRPIDIFISRLSPYTDSDDVKNCVYDILGNELSYDIECNQLKPKIDGLYSSFYVAVTVDVRDMKRVIELINTADSWPEGVLVRRYFKPKNA